METNSSLNYVMPNLLIGLCKGARSLKAYSTIFHDQLGYEFFRLELSFPLSIGRNINPDAMIISIKIGNTLIFEWTETNNPSQKQDQLNRYTKVETTDLVNLAAVPPAAAGTHDIVLTLRPSAVEIFQAQLTTTEQSFPILVLDVQDQIILLSKATNRFQITETDEFFTKGIQTDRLPRYLPFSLETCQYKEMAPFVIQQLVSLLVKGEKTFTLLDYCSGFIPAWNWIGGEKQSELSRVVKEIINHLVQRRIGAQMIKRIADNPPTWELSPELFKKNPKSYRNQFNEFIAEIRGESYQLVFDFGQDIQNF